MTDHDAPIITSQCCDCGLGTLAAGEWYMVDDRIWEVAWVGRLKPWHALPGQQILCIGCLEKRIHRKLTRRDFIDVPINDPGEYPHKSARLLDRLKRRSCRGS